MQRSVALSLIALLLVGMGYAYAHAQSVGTTDPLTVDVSPDYPTPYSQVTITPQSTLFDIAGSTVTVSVNGVQKYSGSGSTPITVQIGGPGVSTSIVVTAKNGDSTYSKKIIITPEQVALVTEPISTSHPFYAGKPLISSSGRVRFIALPDFRTTGGKSIDPSSLEYTWRMNNQILETDSGIGKSVLDAQAPQRYRDVTVSVTVQTLDGSLVAQAVTPVSPVDPVTRIYEDDPLLGPIFSTSLSDQTALAGDEETFLGVPYYFPETPTLEWDVNGTPSGTNGDITVRATGNGQGTASLAFTASDDSTSQTANSTVSVLFGASSGIGIFGL